MNRNYFGYTGFAIFIAMCLCLSSSTPVEAQMVRCYLHVRNSNTCDRDGGWVYRTALGHVETCAAGHRYWGCHAYSRTTHANCRAPATTPAPTTRQTTSQTTTRQTTTRQTTTRQSQSQTPQQEQTPRRQQPQESCKKPTLTLKKLVIGRSATDSAGLNVPITFITDTKTSCQVKAEITYYGSQPPNTCEITSGSWSVTMTHGFRVSGQASETTEGSGYSKVWKYEATFTDSRSDVISSSSDKYAARNKERIRLNLTFTGTHSGGTVTKSAQIIQDQVDGMRQEYIDYNLHHTLRVLPSRGWFVETLSVTAPDGSSTFTVSPRDSDYNSYKNSFSSGSKKPQEAFYNWGHYDYLIDSKTEANYAIWMQHVDKRQLGLRSEVITCRYRPPHHNKRVGGVIHSTHQYGYALDVRGSHKSDGTEMSKTEREKMELAARDAGARHYYISGIPHVHADWAPTWWDDHRDNSGAQLRDMAAARDASRPSTTSNNGGSDDNDDSSSDSSDDSSSTTSTTTSPTVSNNGGGTGGGTGGSDTRVRCGHGNACSRGGYASSREAHKTTCPAGHSYYTCSATGTSRHANCRARGNGEVRCGNGSWCRSGGWASSRNAHKVTCAAGHSYWGCNPTQVSRHRNCRR